MCLGDAGRLADPEQREQRCLSGRGGHCGDWTGWRLGHPQSPREPQASAVKLLADAGQQ